MTHDTQGPLIVIGGHEDKEGDRLILKEVAKRLHGGKLVIATVASHQPEGYFDAYQAAFRELEGIAWMVRQTTLRENKQGSVSARQDLKHGVACQPSFIC